jgi:hypothetical protein
MAGMRIGLGGASALIAGVFCAGGFAVPAHSVDRGASVPDFSGFWARTSLGFESPATGHGPLANLNHRANGASNLSLLAGDDKDPILKPVAAEVVRKLAEWGRRNEAFPQPSNQCLPYPPPYIASNNQEVELIQLKDRVLILTMFDHQIRTVRLNARHPAKLTTSWYGDSVGHYEGGTLVIDTVGIKLGPYPMTDMMGTPFSKDLHVVERFRLVDAATAKVFAERGEAENGVVAGLNGDGVEIDPVHQDKGLQLTVTVEDPAMLNAPWSGTVTYRRPLLDWAESVCAENTHEYYANRDTTIPHADKPDF